MIYSREEKATLKKIKQLKMYHFMQRHYNELYDLAWMFESVYKYYVINNKDKAIQFEQLLEQNIDKALLGVKFSKNVSRLMSLWVVNSVKLPSEFACIVAKEYYAVNGYELSEEQKQIIKIKENIVKHKKNNVEEENIR